MRDYDLYGLDVRTFQQMVQALAIQELGAGLVVYGDGPDGARDASFDGRLRYPSEGNPWDGRLVIQAKYRQKPFDSTKAAGDWVCEQLWRELDKMSHRAAGWKSPDYYLLITNVDLTPAAKTGSHARVMKLLEHPPSGVSFKASDFWDGNKLRRLLDKHRSIAIAYGGFITLGDVLSKMHSWLDGLSPDFERVMSDCLQGELAGPDQYARLTEAGSASERRTFLARVFVDLPVSDTPYPSGAPDAPQSESTRHGFVREVLEIAGLKFDRASVLQRLSPTTGEEQAAAPDGGRYVLVGGPGQGKSTLGQFICQLFRAAILRDRPASRMSDAASEALGAAAAETRSINAEETRTAGILNERRARSSCSAQRRLKTAELV